MEPYEVIQRSQAADSHLDQALQDAQRNMVYDTDAVPPERRPNRIWAFIRSLLNL